MILSCQNISKSFSADSVLKDVSFQINEHEKYAVVGSNGTGKSTLLKIIVQKMEADEGQVVLARDTSIGYLAQYQDNDMPGTIYDIVLEANVDLIRQEQNLRQMEEEMKNLAKEDLAVFMEKYHHLSDVFERNGGLTYRSEATGILKGLGFSEEEFKKTFSMLSGGQKTRVMLGKLLVTKPDLLLLDEPINHLDLHSIEWLESFLSNYGKAVIIVAHDRYFLDRVCDHVLDLSNHQNHVYKGNYSAYIKQKEILQKTLEKSYEKQQKTIAHEEEVITKLQSFNREKSIKRAESRKKLLNKMEVFERPTEENTKMHLSLEPDQRSGNDVLSVQDLSKKFDEAYVFQNISFEIHRGDRTAILGDNGTGKTTILKIINTLLTPTEGSVKRGANVTIGYYDQEQQALDEEKTLFDEMQDAYPNLDNTKIRNILAAFLFTNEDVFKKIKFLSGGERGRVSLAKLMLSGANFLILDEPTNHLDMESKEILENALNRFSGTILYVSHDRYFINRTAKTILELTPNEMVSYMGNYDDYVARKAQRKISFNNEAESFNGEMSSVTDDACTKADWKEQKKNQAKIRKKENERRDIEKNIEKIEAEVEKINQEFLKEEVATNSAKLNELSARQKELNTCLEEYYDRWEQLVDEEN